MSSEKITLNKYVNFLFEMPRLLFASGKILLKIILEIQLNFLIFISAK